MVDLTGDDRHVSFVWLLKTSGSFSEVLVENVSAISDQLFHGVDLVETGLHLLRKRSEFLDESREIIALLVDR